MAGADAQGDSRSGRHTLAIEFSSGPESVAVTFFQPTVRETSAGSEIEGQRPLFTLEVSRAYVERNQRLILEDCLGPGGVDALLRLRPPAPDPL